MFVPPSLDACAIERSMTVAEVTEVVGRCVPDGTTRADAEEFLEANGIEFRFSLSLGQIEATYRHGFLWHRQTGIQIRIDQGVVSHRNVGAMMAFL